MFYQQCRMDKKVKAENLIGNNGYIRHMESRIAKRNTVLNEIIKGKVKKKIDSNIFNNFEKYDTCSIKENKK